ncbi:Transcription initiation factor TFIID subunit 7-like [Saguinus oedipus]|uniref:Transcription initiation factor TFIID subunit 7-like n=1 Tax=Saguinus oedipus TaxID=9490 RepID=A0ABQ9TG62_SAGOE|nr:Transcription initiation factor TFIID subunit 7-like [Saguinus oedipus]
MECPAGQLLISSENNSTPVVSTSEVISQQEPQILVDHVSETNGKSSAAIDGDQGTQIPDDQDSQRDADSSVQDAAKAPENSQEGKGRRLFKLFPPPEDLLLEKQTAFSSIKNLFESQPP